MSNPNSLSIDTLTCLIQGNQDERGEDTFVTNSIDGLSVYRNNYMMSLISALKNTYIITERLLGENNFRVLARKFAMINCSKNPNLNEYGKAFPSFLSDVPELEEIGYIRYISSLDLFWFLAEESREASIKLPKGVLSLWTAINNENELDNIVIDEETTESVSIKKVDGEIFLIGKVDD